MLTISRDVSFRLHADSLSRDERDPQMLYAEKIR